MLAPAESLPVRVRAYARPVKGRTGISDDPKSPLGPSEWAIIFDSETYADAAQQGRVCAYQLRQRGRLRKQGLVYDPRSLTDPERSAVYRFPAARCREVGAGQVFSRQIFAPYLFDRPA